MPKEIIETRSARIWLGEDGIFRLVASGVPSTGLATARENWKAIEQVKQGRIRPMFADIRNAKSVDIEERRLHFNGLLPN